MTHAGRARFNPWPLAIGVAAVAGWVLIIFAVLFGVRAYDTWAINREIEGAVVTGAGWGRSQGIGPNLDHVHPGDDGRQPA